MRNFIDLTEAYVEPKKGPRNFIIVTPEAKHLLRAESTFSRQGWLNILQQITSKNDKEEIERKSIYRAQQMF